MSFPLPYGITIPAISQLGDLVAALFSTRSIGPLIANVTIEEVHHDELAITDHPVDRNAEVSDHAYKRPETVVIRAGWSNSSPQNLGSPEYVNYVYQQLLALQESRELISIVTGRRDYENMLIQRLTVTTNEQTENSLLVTCECREVIIATTQTTAFPGNEAQKDPSDTGAVEDVGSVSPQPPTDFNFTAAGRALPGVADLAAARTFAIPLLAQAQRLSVSMAGVARQITTKWCKPANCWVMDLATQAGVPIATGLPMVTGAGLLSQLDYMEIGADLVVQSSDNADAVPTYENLGTVGQLYMVVP